jgi:hypothetical protein
LIYAGLAIAIAIAYWVFAQFNEGFHMHDEVSHYLSMKGLWHQPWDMLSIWQKPGYKFLFFPFSGLGETLMVFLHAACVAGAAWFAGKIMDEVELPQWRWLAMIFTAFQPIVWQTAFRFNSENFAALLLAASAFYWYRQRWYLSALLISYAMVTRFELGLVAVVLGIALLARKEWRAAFSIATFPLIVHMLGWAHEGDPLFFFSMISGGSGYNYPSFGFFYNWKMLAPASGVLVVGLALVGIMPLGKSLGDLKQYWSRHLPLLASFGAVFIGYCLFTSDWFPWLRLQTQDRAFVQFAPALGTLAALGFAHLHKLRQSGKWQPLALLGVFAALIGVFNRALYVHPNRFAHTDPATGNRVNHAPVSGNADLSLLEPVIEPSYLLMALLLLGSAFALRSTRLSSLLIAGVLVAVLGIHTIASEKPTELSPEDSLCKQVAEWVEQNNLDTATVLCAHNVFHYFAGNTITEDGEAQRLRWQNALRAPKGSVLLWENRYAYQPTRSGFRNTPLDSLTSHPEWFRPLTNGHFQATKGNFAVVPFVKVAGPQPVPAALQEQ